MQKILTSTKQTKDRKVTFYAKEPTRCPVCDASFHREELFSGRVNADEMTDELHRTYKPLSAFGEVYPLVYEIEVCPACFYAAYRPGFMAAGAKFADALRERTDARVEEAQRVFSPIDYQSPRNLLCGAASYYLAMQCYELFSKEFAPTIKCAISSIRTAWLCHDLHAKAPTENWDYVAGLFYRKARFYYRAAIELEQSGKEPYSSQRNLGPDTDKNYGHEGVLYTAAILELKYGPTDDPAIREERLKAAKVSVARMFGFGKKNKSKPGPLLEKARDLYERLKRELREGDDEDE
ncbi:MAG TPA: DUF2225 domain-containing protein [Spirochaetales bacterium]|nr:DUF2225 domain-containing protein [Spirochaetales bacterium]